MCAGHLVSNESDLRPQDQQASSVEAACADWHFGLRLGVWGFKLEGCRQARIMGQHCVAIEATVEILLHPAFDTVVAACPKTLNSKYVGCRKFRIPNLGFRLKVLG